ncbi:MAG: multicopper oxidase domain-containing protein [Rhodospirillales bacterium]|nr:multicopper oxidase domain-containing protein [Rhodospirillales bacterium]
MRGYAEIPVPPGVHLLDPRTVPQFEVPLPDALDPAFKFPSNTQVAIHAFSQDLGLTGLSPQPKPTRLYGYGRSAGDATYPGKTFDVPNGGAHTVTWRNALPTGTPHLLPVDNTIHTAWSASEGPSPYTFPTDLPVVTHLHGGYTDSGSDGFPEFAQMRVQGGRITVIYDRQEAATLWYHDHALGITRLNVYAGLVGFNIVRDEFDTGDAATNSPKLPAHPYEQLIVVQDRMFTDDFQLYFPSAPLTAIELFGPADYPDPTVMAEFFGNHIIVNGKAWAVLDVEPRLYRLRFLNGCDSRFLNMSINGLGFLAIGTDQGLLNAPVRIRAINLAPAERLDVLIDFSKAAGETLVLKNDAPGTLPDPLVLNPRTTGRIMAFRVGSAVTDTANNAVPRRLRGGAGLPPALPPPPAFDPVDPPPGITVRQVVLYEGTDPMGRIKPVLGTLQGPLMWSDPTTETIAFNATEIWEIYNTTEDAHPIHLHLVAARIVNRQRIEVEKFVPGPGAAPPPLCGRPKAPKAEENGRKDTFKAYAGTVTRIIATFDKRGTWVWHCHILSHEDHEMMRRFTVA